MKFGYIRVSTEEQNLARQIEAMKKASIPEENIYADKKSGKDLNREQFKRLLEVVRRGDSITVIDITRLGRNMRDIVNVVYELDSKGITIISQKEGVDTSTEIGRKTSSKACTS